MIRTSLQRLSSTTPAAAVRCSSSAAGTYLHESEIPTMHFQKSLPRLPIPKLEDTMVAYLKSAKVVTTEEQYAQAEADVAAFKADAGPRLHEELVAFDQQNKQTSFINKMWFDMYVSDRQPLPINYNPQLTWKDSQVPGFSDQATRTAALITSTLRFVKTLQDNKLKPEVFALKPDKIETSLYKNICRFLPESLSFYGSYMFDAYPLDMSQFKNLFCSTRIPRVGMDEVLLQAQASNHIVVQRGTDFFKLDVLNADGSMVPQEDIHAGLEAILNTPPGSDPPMGLLTSMDRDEWAGIREQLYASPVNSATLDAIDSAITIVCLDGSSPTELKDIGSTMLHGDATNRWFDKSFQLIVTANGKASVNFEHSWGDGVAVLRYFNEVFAASEASEATTPSASSATVTKLEWDVPESTTQRLSERDTEFHGWLDTLSTDIATIESVHRKWPKKFNIGVDGMMQMAIQLAHYKMHNKMVSTYESASTAAFRHGRTETIRSATSDAEKFCQLMTSTSASPQEQVAQLRTCIDTHNDLVKTALTGKGMDRHMFALKHFAENNGETHNIFNNESKAVMDKIIISTSTLSSPALAGGGFGPVNDECYGVGYGIEEEGARFAVSTYRSDGDQMAAACQQSITDIQRVLEEVGPPQK